VTDGMIFITGGISKQKAEEIAAKILAK